MRTTERGTSRRGIIAGALAALVVAATIAVVRQRAAPDLVVQSDEGWTSEVRVAIAGEIVSPGTYTLVGNARVADLITAAGGYTDTANREVLNPAARVSDGQSYTIPTAPTPAPRAATTTARAAAASPPALPAPPAPPAAPATTAAPAVARLETIAAAAQRTLPTLPTLPTAIISGTASAVTVTPADTGKVNLNTATKAELEALPLIGPALADRIIADRAANGPYRTVDDLARIRGISPRTVEQLRDKITV